jgi:hypothetical protein
MRRDIPLKSITYAAGGRALIELDQLPGEHYLHSILFQMPFDVVCPAAAMAAVVPATFNRLIDSVKVGRRISATGQALNVLKWLMTGRDHSATAYIPANANGTVSRILNVSLPFIDPTAYEPDDTAAAVELFKDTPVELGFGSDVTLLPGRTTFTPGVFQAVARIVKGAPGKLSTPVNVDVVDLTPDSRIDPGVVTHLALLKEDGSAITSAEVTSLSVIIDGVAQLAALFNDSKAMGGEPASNLTATPFTTIPGESVNEQPGGAVAAGSGVSVDFLPLLYPVPSGKLTKAWPCPTGIRIKWSGSATSLRAVVRRVEPVSDAAVVKAAEKMGLQAPTAIVAKTSSGATTSPWKSALLPKKFTAIRK